MRRFDWAQCYVAVPASTSNHVNKALKMTNLKMTNFGRSMTKQTPMGPWSLPNVRFNNLYAYWHIIYCPIATGKCLAFITDSTGIGGFRVGLDTCREKDTLFSGINITPESEQS